MHLEQLTKTQIVLLTLLVAIVSATASAIVTVSLMSQAPPSVSATVDRIIEKTVQQIVPSASSTPSTPIKTVVVNGGEMAPAAIATVQKSIIRLVVQGDPSGTLVARGVIVSARGTALTDAKALDPAQSYEAILPNGSRTAVTFNSASTTGPFLPLTLKSASTASFTSATIADPKKLQLGESVIRVSGVGADTAGMGIISALPNADTPNVTQTDLASKVPGAIIIDLSGSVIGMTTSASLTLGETYYSLISNK